jgi:Spy/CpxP family protein refolding chaperone
MKKKIGMLLAVVALLALTATSVMAMGPGGSGCGFGPRFHGPDQGAWMRHLKLSPEQQEKILDIKQQFEKESLPIRQNLEKKRLELQKLWKAEKPNQNAIENKMKEMVPLKVTLRMKMRAMREAIFNVLTPEQQKQIHDRFQNRKGPHRPGHCQKAPQEADSDQ